MPRATWAIAGCTLVLATGCHGLAPTPDKPASGAIARSLTSGIPADGLVVEKVLLERPLGDRFLNHDLWYATLCTVPPEMRELLASNGIQVGVLGGNLPGEFQSIVSNAAETIDPRMLTFNHLKEAVIPTAGPIADCKYEVLPDLAGKLQPIALKDARCGILVRPQQMGDGRIKLWCEPQIQHGERQDRFRPSEDGTQFTKFEEFPTEKYAELGFEVALRPDECLVIGSIAEARSSLGSTLFEAEASGNARQRVVVIRARQVNVSPTADLPAITAPGRRSAPTAIPTVK
jgi:hypothetical protein